MRRCLTALTVSALIGSAGAPAFADDLKASIDARNSKFEEAYNAGDADAVAGFYATDGAVLPPGAARQEGREAIRAFWSGAMEHGLKDLDLTAVEVYAQGNMATEVGTFTATMPAAEGSGATGIAGKYLVLWKLGDGGNWQLYRDIWNTGQ